MVVFQNLTLTYKATMHITHYALLYFCTNRCIRKIFITPSIVGLQVVTCIFSKQFPNSAKIRNYTMICLEKISVVLVEVSVDVQASHRSPSKIFFCTLFSSGCEMNLIGMIHDDTMMAYNKTHLFGRKKSFTRSEGGIQFSSTEHFNN